VEYLFALLSIVLGSVAQVSMKIGANQFHSSKSLLANYLNLYVLIGFILYGISAVLWIYALSKIPLSIAYPMVSFGYIIVVIASYFILHEPINVLKSVGLFIIIIGVVLISKS
jgi:multidrug transporter EmrE-like cation transporter